MVKELQENIVDTKKSETEKGTVKKTKKVVKKPEKMEVSAESHEVKKTEVAEKQEKTEVTSIAIRPETRVDEKVSETQLLKEFKKRAGIIQKQMSNIQKSFLIIAFQLHWIKEHDMYTSMGYKNIYEYAEMEYGIGRSSCGNFICIIDNFAQRDELGNVIERLEEQYQNFTSSQLIAMIGMTEEGKKRITPDMSVRLINRIRKQEAQARIGTIRNFSNGTNEGKAEDAREAPVVENPAVEQNAVPEKQAESGAVEENNKADAIVVTAKGAEESHIAEDNGSPAVNKAPESGEESRGIEKEKDAVVSASESDPAPAPAITGETKKPPRVATVVPAGSNAGPDAKKNAGTKSISTLLTFSSYSNFQKELEHMHSLVADIFKQSKVPVTVKIVCEQGIA